MAQLVDFATLAEKSKDWHLSFVREVLEHVATESPSERKYSKWIRERKVFDRKFLAFCERFLGFPRQPGQAPALSEVGRDLWDSLQKARRKIAEETEKAQKKAQAKLDLPPNGPIPAPGRRAAPPPRAANPEDELDEEKAFGNGGPGGDAAPATLASDSFQKELLDRFVELHGYLARFVLGEIGDGYLAVSELYRRVGTSAYAGRRPSMPQFETWVRWGEWLGAIEKIGFRHRATAAGRDLGKYLKSLPESELLVASPEDELLVEVPVAAPAPAAAPLPALVPNAPTNRRSLEVREDGDGDESDEGEATSGLASDEGLDLPPETRAPETESVFWADRPHDDAAAPRGPLPDALIPAKPAAASAPVPARAPAPAPSAPPAPPTVPAAPPASPAPVPQLPAEVASDSVLVETGFHMLPRAEAVREHLAATAPRETASSAWARPPVPYSPEALAPAERSRLAAGAGHVLAWWTASGRPGQRVRASEAGIDLAVYRGPGRGVLVFKLLVLGALLEAPTDRGRALAFARELERARALEALFVEDLPLERVLEPAGLLDPARTLSPSAEKLVHALRFRAALKREGTLARIDAAPGGRELARTLRREVAGDSLGPGVVFAVREMARAGHWRPAGVDGLACVPWRDVREAAARLGLLESPRAATFEDVLAASEALSRFFREAEEGETPLAAYARSLGWTHDPEEGRA